MTTIQTTKYIAGVISPVDITTSENYKNGQYISPNSIFIQHDGKILVTGRSGDEMILIRFNADGSFDQSFNKNGVVLGDNSHDGKAVIAQDSGKITVIGDSGNGTVQLSRYNQDGSIDTSFDSDGKVTMGNDIYVESGIIQDDGKILVVGYSSPATEPNVMRYNENGTLDTSFDDDGKVETNSSYSVAIQDDGKILIGSRKNNNYLLMRYNENGSLDTSFDTDGKVEYYSANSGYINSIAVQSNGKIIATGGDGYYGNGTLFRYNSDGSLDTSFNKSGLVGLAGVGSDVKIQDDGKILVVVGGKDFIIMRYNIDGTLDTSFDGDGKVETDINGDSDHAKSIAIQDNGKILVAGSTGYLPYFMALARYNSDGSLDYSFKNDSSVAIEYPPSGVLGIYGTVEQDQALYVLNNFGDKNGISGKINYQWFRSGVAIAGETGGFYVLTAEDVNHAISVKASYVDGNNHAESITSSATEIVKPSADAELSEPTYTLTVSKNAVNEGDTVTFNLTTENVESGTEIPFTFGGSISNQDVLGGLKTNSFIVDSKGNASLAVKFLADKFTDGQTENLTLTLASGESQNVTVKDTSLAIVTPTKTTPTSSTSTVKIDGITKTAKSNTKDLLIGTEKNDSLTGLAGADTLRGNAGHDVLNGGLGNDSLDGGNGNDTLNGGEGNDKLISGSGDDKLDAGKGNDTLDGGAGKDTLNGGAGVDSMTGGDGDDFYFVDNVKDKVIETNANATTGGKDTVTSNSPTYTLGANIENLILEDLQGKGTSGAGNKGNNVITGSIGDNKLEGLAGNDTLIGNDGDDTLDGGLGMDSLVGGNGDDLYIMNNAGDVIQENPNEGIDQIFSKESFNLGQSENVEYLTLSGAKAVEGTGNNLDNLLQEESGGKTNNVLSGGEGNDTLNGEGGNDTLEGGDGNDELNGGDGTDVAIFSGEYSDYLITLNPDVEGVPQLVVEYKNDSSGILDGIDMLSDIEILEFADGDKHNVSDVLQDIGVTESDTNAQLILTGIDNLA